jgi:hypothetical protein
LSSIFSLIVHTDFFLQTLANKRELILHSEKAGCKSVLCDNCSKRFATSSTLRAHFCLSKRETIDADFEGIIELQINTETPGFQVILTNIFQKLDRTMFLT